MLHTYDLCYQAVKKILNDLCALPHVWRTVARRSEMEYYKPGRKC